MTSTFHFQSEMSQIIEDSKKIIPEWKKNLIKQKEMKKISINQQNVSSSLKKAERIISCKIFPHVPEECEIRFFGSRLISLGK